MAIPKSVNTLSAADEQHICMYGGNLFYHASGSWQTISSAAAGGIPSNPAVGNFQVTNLSVSSVGKLIVEYDDGV